MNTIDRLAAKSVEPPFLIKGLRKFERAQCEINRLRGIPVHRLHLEAEAYRLLVKLCVARLGDVGVDLAVELHVK